MQVGRGAYVGGPTGPGRAAPGPGGYALAVIVATTVGTVVLTASAGAIGSGVAVPFFIVYSITGLPFAVGAFLVLHLCCRRLASQTWHVAVAAVLGGATGWLLAATLADGFAGADLVIAAAFGAAVGRAALVPAVQRQRALSDVASQ